MATTKERILDITAEMFRRYGYVGTGIKQILAEANAPFGSLYHHFPGGKEQLGEQAIRRSGRMYRDLVEAVIDTEDDLASGTRNVFTGAAAALRETDYADACPIATVALEVASTNESLRTATAEVFASWIETATGRITAAGVPEHTARELAIAVVAQLEGAFVLSRAMRSTEPLEVLGNMAGAAIAAAVDAARAPDDRERAGR